MSGMHMAGLGSVLACAGAQRCQPTTSRCGCPAGAAAKSISVLDSVPQWPGVHLHTCVAHNLACLLLPSSAPVVDVTTPALRTCRCCMLLAHQRRSPVTASGLPKSLWNSRSLDHTMQWMGLSGVLRSVQMGKLLGTGLGWHSKHSVWSFRCTVTWGRQTAGGQPWPASSALVTPTQEAGTPSACAHDVASRSAPSCVEGFTSAMACTGQHASTACCGPAAPCEPGPGSPLCRTPPAVAPLPGTAC
jgi:hypothetical protein